MISSLASVVIWTAFAAAPDVIARPLEGDSVTGRLVALTGEQAKLDSGAGPMEIPTARLMWLEIKASSGQAKPAVWIEMLDGSRVSAAAYSAVDGKARLTLVTGQIIEVPTRAVHTVRFQQQSPELATQWREITSSMASGDMVVIRKTSTRTIEQGENEPRIVTDQALDQVEGTLLDVTPESVQFETDGQKILIRREKLEGIVYYHPAKRTFAPPLCRLVDAGGSVWLLKQIALEEDQIAATTTGNVSLRLPLAAVAKLDFSVGNVAFLADLEPNSGGGEVAVSLQPAAMTYKFSRVFQLRAGPPVGSSGFRIGGQKFDAGLSLHSPAKLVYRVPDGFSKFYAAAGVDDSVVAPGRFNLVILGDGKELARHTFSGDDRRQPLSLALDVKGVRRFTIELEAAAGQDIGDQLDLCEARFTK